MKKWVIRKTRSILSGEFYKKKQTQQLTVETDEGDTFEREGKIPGREEGRTMSIEELQAQRQQVADFMKSNWEGVKKIANEVVKLMRKQGDEGDQIKYMKADVLENLVNSYQVQLDQILDQGNMTILQDAIKLKSTGGTRGRLVMNLDPDKFASIDFRKLITRFRKKQGDNYVETEALKNFAQLSQKEREQVQEAKNAYSQGVPIETIAQKMGISIERVAYYLTTASQDLTLNYKKPSPEEYYKIVADQTNLKKFVVNYMAEKSTATPTDVKVAMIDEITKNGYLGSLNDAQLLKLMKETQKKGTENILSQLHRTPTQDELYMRYLEEFGSDARQLYYHKMKIGDTLRWDIGNWVGTLLQMIKNGQTDLDSMKLFLSFINPHTKLRYGNRYKGGGTFDTDKTKALWRLYGYDDFSKLSPEIQQKLKSNNISDLNTKLASVKNMLILHAFNEAMGIMEKLANLKKNMIKQASISSIDEQIANVAGVYLDKVKKIIN